MAYHEKAGISSRLRDAAAYYEFDGALLREAADTIDGLVKALDTTLHHAALFNRDGDDIWDAVKSLAEASLAKARGEN